MTEALQSLAMNLNKQNNEIVPQVPAKKTTPDK